MFAFPLCDAAHELVVGMLGQNHLQFHQVMPVPWAEGTPLPRRRKIRPVFDPFGTAS